MKPFRHLPWVVFTVLQLVRASAQNLVVNGDFEQGNTGFTTQYQYNATINVNAGYYSVEQNPLDWYYLFANFTDHTSGSGNMMVFNGATTPSVVAWSQNATVQPNRSYEFSAWAASMYSLNPSSFQFRINGVSLSPLATLPSQTGVWTRYAASWNSGNATSANLEIVFTTTAYDGNDTALDDIAFRETDWVQWKASDGGNGHWYKAVAKSGNMTVRTALQAAIAGGGYLATVTSAAENDFVFSMVNSTMFFQSHNGAGPALGGIQATGAVEPLGGWGWVSKETWNYSNWNSIQPDDGQDVANGTEQNLQYFSGSSNTPGKTWNDITLDDPNMGGYIMERDGPAPTAAPGPVVVSFNGTDVVQWTTDATATSYKVQMRPVAGNGTWTQLAWVSQFETWYDLNNATGLTANTTYEVQVVASNVAGDSAGSNLLSFATPTMVPGDDFDPHNAPFWSSITGGVVTASVTGNYSGALLHFTNSGTRAAATVPLDGTQFKEVHFAIRVGTATTPWENADAGEDVVLEVTLNGTAWSELARVSATTEVNGWQLLEVVIPASWRGNGLQLRWRQLSNSGSGFDQWGLDNIALEAWTDTDGDGMEDAWEQQYFGGLDRDGTGDYERDGLVDLDEFLQGRNPLVADNVNGGWVEWKVADGGNGHWYKAVSRPSDVTWNQAGVLAEGEGGYLATLTSRAENDFVYGLINSAAYFSGTGYGDGGGPFIGGTQPAGSAEPSGNWTWVTGENWTYANWRAMEPGNSNGAGLDEECLQFRSQTFGVPYNGWNDVDENDSSAGGYVVERNTPLPLAPPSAPVLSLGGAALLGWSSLADADGYKLYYRQSGQPDWALLETLAGNITTLDVSAHSGFQAGATYEFQLTAFNDRGEGIASNMVSCVPVQIQLPPPVPFFFVAVTSGMDAISLLWIDNAGETSYEIQWAPNQPGPWSPLATLPADTTLYTDTGLQPTTSYYYRCRAVNAAGSSVWSPVTSERTWNRLQYWRYLHWGEPENEGDGKNDANPSGDGVDNLSKYAFNLDPLASDNHVLDPVKGTSGLPSLGVESEALVTMARAAYDVSAEPGQKVYWLKADYVRRKASTYSAVTYRVEFSDDPSFTGTIDTGTEVDVVSIDDQFERVYVQDTVDTQTASRRFVRVRVTPDE